MNYHSLLKVIAIALISAVSFFSNAEPTWIDVRSAAEHKLSHIDGDLRITHTDIVEKVNELFPSKDHEIRLYCRSGYRANIALEALQAAGYTNVSNAGGIEDARKERG
ncbi:rhodanese-like domain-containing protein [Alteromonas sp. a30]|uniref:rhodanese-like domain-containing protein n=1 Tax=Alteromonas sp. a30 TaxID=2730917 RepID=UPI00227DC275|nr:rhodanese-like domain-containing protein [Alteromonas sp. a30]MCY7297274.1 rhodanese-like domain-containing protein [Alteromonas sp. a30]